MNARFSDVSGLAASFGVTASLASAASTVKMVAQAQIDQIRIGEINPAFDFS